MSTLLEPQSRDMTGGITARSVETNDQQAGLGQRLQAETTAVRLKIHWLGTRKTLSPDQTRVAATSFDADTKSLSASKKLFDTGHPAFRAATAVKTKVAQFWKAQTLPYIEPGVRLIRRRDVDAFDAQMRQLQAELGEAVQQLSNHFDELVDQARERLGNLFDPTDYAVELQEMFAIEWDYPSCDPPAYLLQVSPELYYSECARVQTRFDEAVRLAEQAFAEELSQLVSHLAERLSGQDGDSPKVFRDSAVTNLLEFFQRFQRLNIRSNDQLDALVAEAREVVSGVGPQTLRDHARLRERVASQLAQVEGSLDQWLSDRPRRSILRKSR